MIFFVGHQHAVADGAPGLPGCRRARKTAILLGANRCPVARSPGRPHVALAQVVREALLPAEAGGPAGSAVPELVHAAPPVEPAVVTSGSGPLRAPAGWRVTLFSSDQIRGDRWPARFLARAEFYTGSATRPHETCRHVETEHHALAVPAPSAGIDIEHHIRLAFQQHLAPGWRCPGEQQAPCSSCNCAGCTGLFACSAIRRQQSQPVWPGRCQIAARRHRSTRRPLPVWRIDLLDIPLALGQIQKADACPGCPEDRSGPTHRRRAGLPRVGCREVARTLSLVHNRFQSIPLTSV